MSAPPPSATPPSGALALPSGPRRDVLAFALALALVVTVLSALRLQPPSPLPADAPGEAFSAARALVDLKAILGPRSAPRPVGSRANHSARARLIQRLEALGLKPEVQDRFVVSGTSSTSAQVKNVLAELPGTDPSLPALLLVAHYDSVAAGPGVGDDLSGCATLLEIARALQSSERLRSVLFLFSDGEEAGLLGAQAFAGIPHPDSTDEDPRYLLEPHPWLERVGAVINLECRGSSGPSLLFQTGPQSGRIVSTFAARAPRPVTGSSFAAVYERMRNDTDLTPFKARGLPGLNLAFIGGIGAYHTALDDLAHLDARSVQHHGSNALATVRALANEPLESSAGGDLVYFDLLALGVVRWPAPLSPLLAALALALLLVNAALLARGGRSGWATRSFAWGFVAFLFALALTTGLCAFGARAFSPHVPTPWPADPAPLLALFLSLSLLGVALAGYVGARGGFWGSWLATWTVWGGVGLGLALAIPGFSYLFLVPALVAGLAGLPAALGKEPSPAASTLAALAPWLAAVLLWAPMLILMQQALGLASFRIGGALEAICPLAICLGLLVSLLLPCVSGTGQARAGLACATLGLALVTGVAATGAPAYQRVRGLPGDIPQRADLVYHHDFGSRDEPSEDASWIAFPAPPLSDPYTGEPYPRPSFLASAPRTFDAEATRVLSGLRMGYHAEGTPLRGAKPPALADLKIEAHGEGRRVSFRLVSPRGAGQGAVILDPAESRLLYAKVGGQLVPKGRRRFWCYTLPKEGLAVELHFKGKGPGIEFTVLDASRGLPPSGRVLEDLRKPVGTPTSIWADLHVQTLRVNL